MSAFARPWPRTLFGRLVLILFAWLALAHVFAFGFILYERMGAARTMMLDYVPKDVATAVAILERVPAAERAAWLPRLKRENYRYTLEPMPDGGPIEAQAQALLAAMQSELGAAYRATATALPHADHALQVRLQLKLRDGTPLAVDFTPPDMAVSPAALLGLTLQLVTLLIGCWVTVRLATRPLRQLARAADSLGPDARGAALLESGPTEVLQAARAFNAMRRRIADYLAERLQLLAAISHDLQTPIARMRLRADLLEEPTVREKFRADLTAMQAMVAEGIAYARSAQSVGEPPRRIDVQALLDSIAADYADTGQRLSVISGAPRAVVTRPNALRRILANLIDNALKFGAGAEVRIESERAGETTIIVADRGPGVSRAELEKVTQPFYRIEDSRNRKTGGTGLGLAIAQQLASAIGATLTLANREGGGLEARLVLRDLAEEIGAAPVSNV